MPSTSDAAAVEVDQLVHRYGERRGRWRRRGESPAGNALDGLSLQVRSGELFAVLGPNGGGKTTLFRVLSTMIAPQQGTAAVLGHRLPQQTNEVRKRIGVVFQSPSLDRKLTVAENIRHQAALYGLTRQKASQRADALLAQLQLDDRRHQRVEHLSGGLRRRAELAKGMIHQPQLLLLDEPSTGLDPGARGDLWQCLKQLQAAGATIVLTTHLLDEAEKADRIAILNHGRLVALGEPDSLRAEVGGDSICISTSHPEALAAAISERFEIPAAVVDGQVRLEQPDGHRWIPRLVEALGGQIDAIRLGKPTLEDVFAHKTGRAWIQQPAN